MIPVSQRFGQTRSCVTPLDGGKLANWPHYCQEWAAIARAPVYNNASENDDNKLALMRHVQASQGFQEDVKQVKQHDD